MRRKHHVRVGQSAAALLYVLIGNALIIGSPGVAHADRVREQQWHLDALDLPRAHRIARGDGVAVAVLDTGVDYQHRDLRGAVLSGKSFAAGRRDGWEDTDGHGTAMASLIAGRGHGPYNDDGALGVAPEADVLPIRASTGEVSDTRGLEQGLDWAVARDVEIFNLSGGVVDTADIRQAALRAVETGMVVVASAGNTTSGDYQVMAPARYPGVVAVAGIDEKGDFTEYSVSGPEVVLSAPATNIRGADAGGGYRTGTGTSPAAAIVSGVAALVKSKYPDLDAANVINRLIVTADDRGPKGRDDKYGFGVVDPVAALTEDVPKVDANPLIPPPAKPKASQVQQASGTDPGSTSTLVVLSALGVLGVLGLGAVVVMLAIRRRRVPVGTWDAHVRHPEVRPSAPRASDSPPYR